MNFGKYTMFNNSKKVFISGQLKYSLLVAFLVVIFIAVAYLLVIFINKYGDKKDYDNDKKKLEDDINKIIPNFNFVLLEKDLIKTYKLFLECWENRELENIKKITTKDFYDYLLTVSEELNGYKESIDILSMPTLKLINIWTDNNYIVLQVSFKFNSINYITHKRKIVFGEKNEESTYTELIFKVNKKKDILIDKKIVGLPCFSKIFLKSKELWYNVGK